MGEALDGICRVLSMLLIGESVDIMTISSIGEGIALGTE